MIQFKRGSGHSSTTQLGQGQPYYDYTNNLLFVCNSSGTAINTLEPVNDVLWDQMFHCYRGGANTTGMPYIFTCTFKTKTTVSTASVAGVAAAMYSAGYSSLYAPATGEIFTAAPTTSASTTVGLMYSNGTKYMGVGSAIHYINCVSSSNLYIYYIGLCPSIGSINGTTYYMCQGSAATAISTADYAASGVVLLCATKLSIFV